MSWGGERHRGLIDFHLKVKRKRRRGEKRERGTTIRGEPTYEPGGDGGQNSGNSCPSSSRGQELGGLKEKGKGKRTQSREARVWERGEIGKPTIWILLIEIVMTKGRP